MRLYVYYVKLCSSNTANFAIYPQSVRCHWSGKDATGIYDNCNIYILITAWTSVTLSNCTIAAWQPLHPSTSTFSRSHCVESQPHHTPDNNFRCSVNSLCRSCPPHCLHIAKWFSRNTWVGIQWDAAVWIWWFVWRAFHLQTLWISSVLEKREVQVWWIHAKSTIFGGVGVLQGEDQTTSSATSAALLQEKTYFISHSAPMQHHSEAEFAVEEDKWSRATTRFLSHDKTALADMYQLTTEFTKFVRSYIRPTVLFFNRGVQSWRLRIGHSSSGSSGMLTGYYPHIHLNHAPRFQGSLDDNFRRFVI
ncbi:hypothetical protein BDQ17DRAFT_1536727 [Cyathus striatus]|nr:hypothetical protein BDQ17DRAFT_1536727 [Cyathus striatus]